ncbi:hypothetical protein Cni_G09997 [Canna indica]|uniref:Phosphotransferase n=1 Tax=Canna indica TaxID=4628 RepID=A0AAQ3Q6Y6_9LILI|nr:hypothetical protein Cni_G09997 [Canna indica]
MGNTLVNLEVLQAFRNLLEGPIPILIANDSKLREIVMPYNRLSGTLPGAVMHGKDDVVVANSHSISPFAHQSPTFQVINMESGNFWSSHLPRTSYDIALDDESPNKNDQMSGVSLKARMHIVRVCDIVTRRAARLVAA